HVGQHAQFRKARLQFADCARDKTVWIGGFDAVERLKRTLDRGKQRHYRYAQFHATFGYGKQRIDGVAVYAGHRRHGLLQALAFGDEDRIYEVIDGKGMLTHQSAGEVIATIAPWPGGGKIGLR